jgi:hormone-sensitive lipase
LNDVWQTYYWLVENAESQLGIKPNKIILVGDSAGGNLAAAITIMAITRGYRVPDGLILAYPGNIIFYLTLSILALNLSRNSFTPSLLLALDDPILPWPFLKMCLDSYTGNTVDPDNPYISPSFATDDVLRQFPKTRLMVASNDPLRDESFRFTLRLAYLSFTIVLIFHI